MPATEPILADHVLAAVLTRAKQEFVEANPDEPRLAFRSHNFLL